MPFKLHPLHLMLLGCSLYSYSFAADTPEDEFVFQGVSLFGDANKSLDLRQFEDENHLEAGYYLWQTSVNQKHKAELLVEAKLNQQTRRIEPCFTLDQLKQLGIQYTQLSTEQTCVFPTAINPYLSYEILHAVQKFQLTVPDAVLVVESDHQQKISHGNNSLFSNYSYNYNRSEQIQSHSVNEQHFLGLQSGLNLGMWSLRYDSNISVQNHVADYQVGQYLLYRDLSSLQARMSAGHVNAGGQNSVTVLGVQLENDPMMRPEGQRYYTPQIENIAQSHALVKVLQNGRVVFEKSVTPGPFKIDQLRGLNRYGDLTLEIHENDQSIRRFIIPYAMQLSLLPHKQLNYKVALGEYVEYGQRIGQQVVQGVFEYGLSPRVSVSSELSLTEDYVGTQLGAIYNNQWGGFNTQIDYAQSKILNQTGYKVRLNYQTQSDQSGTNLSASTTRHSIDFPTLSNSLSVERNALINDWQSQYSIQQDWQLSLSQRLGQKAGSLSVNGLLRNYWQTSTPYRQVQMSYANTWRKLQYNFSYSYVQDVSGPSDRNVLLSMNMPLGSAKMSASLQQQNKAQDLTKTNLTYSNRFGDKGQWSYGLSSSHSRYEHEQNRDVGVQLNFNDQKLQANSYYNQNDSSRQWSFSTHGAWVAHRYGITFSPTVGETFAIGHIHTNTEEVKSKGWAQGFDRWGNRIYSNLNPYNRNTIHVNPIALPLNVELDALVHELHPRRYASPLVVFQAARRENVVLILQGNDALNIPLGESVHTAEQQVFGLAGQGNQIFLEDMQLLKHGMTLHWGKASRQSCQLSDIHFEQYDKTLDRLQMLEATCH